MSIAVTELDPSQATEVHELVREFYDFVENPTGIFSAEFSLSVAGTSRFAARDHDIFMKSLGLTECPGMTPKPQITVDYVTLYGRRTRDISGHERAFYATYNWGSLENVPRLLRPAALALTATVEA